MVYIECIEGIDARYEVERRSLEGEKERLNGNGDLI